MIVLSDGELVSRLGDSQGLEFGLIRLVWALHGLDRYKE